MEKYWSCFKFYDERGRRLSLFARKIDENMLEIFKWTCSKKDMINKKHGRKIYEDFLDKEKENRMPEILYKEKAIDYKIYGVRIPKEDGPKYTFLKWAKDNFLKQLRMDIVISTNVLLRMSELDKVVDKIGEVFQSSQETENPELN